MGHKGRGVRSVRVVRRGDGGKDMGKRSKGSRRMQA